MRRQRREYSRVDNGESIPAQVRNSSHACSESTQTNWNGILGRIELEAADAVHISDIRVYPDPEAKSARVRITVAGSEDLADGTRLALSAEAFNAPRRHRVEDGISYNIFKDTLHVIQTIPGCPAEKVGILPGDRIIRVDGRTIAGVNIRRSEIPKLLRGPRGTKVTVEIARLGGTGLLPFVVERDKIPIYSVDAAYMVRPGVGYIKLNSFSVTTPKEVQEAMSRLKKEGMTSLVLDLQGNGGGVMSSAIDLSDQFLDAGKLIVYTQGEHQRRHDALASDRGAFEKGRVVVLIDEYSASASEITAGALQDWDRATVIGRRSFGKGLVQRPISLPDSAELRLTVARYYTPSGRNIQKPYTGGVEQYYKDLETRYRHGELVHADSVHFPDSLKYTTRVEHRTVYGGGGIWPDIFIPLDTTLYSPYYRKVLAKGIFMTEIARYTETNRAQLLSVYPYFSRYEKYFTVP